MFCPPFLLSNFEMLINIMLHIWNEITNLGCQILQEAWMRGLFFNFMVVNTDKCFYLYFIFIWKI